MLPAGPCVRSAAHGCKPGASHCWRAGQHSGRRARPKQRGAWAQHKSQWVSVAATTQRSALGILWQCMPGQSPLSSSYNILVRLLHVGCPHSFCKGPACRAMLWTRIAAEWGPPVPTLPSVEELRQQQHEGQATNDDSVVHWMDLACRQCIKAIVQQIEQVCKPGQACQSRVVLLPVHSDIAKQARAASLYAVKALWQCQGICACILKQTMWCAACSHAPAGQRPQGGSSEVVGAEGSGVGAAAGGAHSQGSSRCWTPVELVSGGGSQADCWLNKRA